MLHEDRILKSIDLLTFNARETLNKYVEWATTANADVTFNLFDALSSYKNNGTTGSAVYLKPLTIPSFTSISKGIFGDVGTSASRDIYWNFDFISNGNGWMFNEYIQSNGSVAKNPKKPKLQINVDTVFGKYLSGTATTVSFNDTLVNLRYSSNSFNSLSLTSNKATVIFPNISIYGKDSAVLFGKYVSFGSNYANGVDSSTSTLYSPGSISERLFVDSKNPNIRQYESNHLHNILSATDIILLGDENYRKNFEQYSSDINVYVNGGYAISIYGKENPSYLLAFDNTTNNAYAFSTLPSTPINTAYVGNGIRRLTSNTQEGFQLFVKNGTSSESTANAYFDVWVEGGLIAGKRSTPIYNDYNNSISDTSVTSDTTSNPYYLNIGTKGKLIVEGQDSLTIKSNNSLAISIGNSEEISISKGSVKIPSLELPSTQRVGLSTLSKNKNISNGPFKLFPTFNLVSSVESCEVNTVDNFTTSDIISKPQDNIWTTYNTDTTIMYSYLYYTEEQSNGTFNMYCKTFTSGLNEGIDPTQNSQPVLVFNTDKDYSEYDITAISGIDNTYLIIKGATKEKLWYNIQYIDIYSSVDRGATFNKVRTIEVYIADNESIHSISTAISTKNVISCGYVDDIWISVVTSDKKLHLYGYESFYHEVIYFNATEIFPVNQYNISTLSLKKNSLGLVSLTAFNGALDVPSLYMILNLKKGYNTKECIVKFTKQDGDINHIYSKMVTAPTSSYERVYSNGMLSTSGSTITIDFMRLSYDRNLNFINKVEQVKFISVDDFTTITFNGNMFVTSKEVPLKITNGTYYDNGFVQRLTYLAYGSISNTVSFKMGSLIQSISGTPARNVIVNSFYTAYLNGKSSVSVIPMNFASFAVNSSNIVTLVNTTISNYSDTSDTIEYQDLITSTFTQYSNVPKYIINLFDTQYRASYVDTLGLIYNGRTNIAYYGSCGSNIIDTKILNYRLNSNNIEEYVSVYNEKGKTLPVAVMSSVYSGVDSGFISLKYVGSAKATAEDYTVNYVTTVNSKIVYNPIVPISIVHANGKSSVLVNRNTGIMSEIDIDSSESIAVGKTSVPVEALSIFTKKAYNSDYTTINRDDMSINFVSSSIYYEGSVEGLVLAHLIIHTYNNSGHDLWLNRENLVNAIAENSHNSSIVDPMIYSNMFLLIYDKVNNRTLAYSQFEGDNKLSFVSDNWMLASHSILVSINSSLLNPYDLDFNNYESIVNEKSNVVSLRIDDFNSIRMQKNFTKSNNSIGLILGFSEINNQEGNC